MTPQLCAIDLGYDLPDKSRLFSSVNLSLGYSCIGLVGANGSGKSTLLELLAGKRDPARGVITRSGMIVLVGQYFPGSEATLAQVSGVSAQLKALERVERGEGTETDFGMLEGWWDLPERIEKEFTRLGIGHLSLNQQVSSVSGGELTRVRLAGALTIDPDFLLLDEPTNHLDLHARRFVYDLVASWRRGLIVVSHDRALLDLVESIAELDAHGLRMYGGNFDFFTERREVERQAAENSLQSAQLRLKAAKYAAQRERERRQKRQFAAARNLAKDNIAPILAGARQRSAQVSSGRSATRHMAKVESLRNEVSEAGARIREDHRIIIDLSHTRVPADRNLVKLSGVNHTYANGSKPLWDAPLNFEITGPERIHLRGRNGAGKSTVINFICGRLHPSEGDLQIKSHRIGLLDQDVTVLDAGATLLENLQRRAPSRPVHELRTLLGRFLFTQDTGLKPARVLSGGERMRAGLACLLCADSTPELLILDEPTNNLDLASIEELTSALREFRGALLVVSHDLKFVEDIGLRSNIELFAHRDR